MEKLEQITKTPEVSSAEVLKARASEKINEDISYTRKRMEETDLSDDFVLVSKLDVPQLQEEQAKISKYEGELREIEAGTINPEYVIFNHGDTDEKLALMSEKISHDSELAGILKSGQEVESLPAEEAGFISKYENDLNRLRDITVRYREVEKEMKERGVGQEQEVWLRSDRDNLELDLRKRKDAFFKDMDPKRVEELKSLSVRFGKRDALRNQVMSGRGFADTSFTPYKVHKGDGLGEEVLSYYGQVDKLHSDFRNAEASYFPRNPEKVETAKKQEQKKEKIPLSVENEPQGAKKDVEALRKVRRSLGMSEPQPVSNQVEKQEAVKESETTEVKEKSEETQDRLEKYKQPDSSINFRKVIDDLGDRNYTGDVQERILIADEALAQLQTEGDAIRKQIEAEKQGGQKSELRALNARDDILYGYEQSVKRLKRNLEMNVPYGKNEQPASDISTAGNVKNENGEQNFVEIKDKELQEEVGNSLREVVQDIDGLEGSLRSSGSFITPRFETDVLRTGIGESGIDFRKISAALEDMTKKLKRDFTIETGGNRPMIESAHYRRVIGALESLENSLTKFRSKIEQRKIETDDGNFENLGKEILTTISAARKNREFLNELGQISQRFEDRR